MTHKITTSYVKWIEDLLCGSIDLLISQDIEGTV